MNDVTIKFQYINYEPGEFSGIRKCSVQEALLALEQFPWVDSRKHLVVGTTTPSITFEKENGELVKVALYYNNKFILYYLSGDRKALQMPLFDLSDASPYIVAFFADAEFVTQGFKTVPVSKVKEGLVTRSFHYKITPKHARKFFLLKCGFFIGFQLATFGISIYMQSLFFLYAMSAFNILVYGLINIFICWKQYSYARDKELILSCGQDTFYYGEAGNLKQYSKADIKNIVYRKSNSSGKRPVSDYGLMQITFSNGAMIFIPSIFCGTINLWQKFALLNVQSIHKRPYVTAKDLTLASQQ